MKSKKFWAAMLAGMMAVGSLTGCGGSSSGGGSAETTAAASQAAPSDVAQATGEDVTIKVALWDYSNTEYYKTMIDAFQAKYPNIEVEVVEFTADEYDNVIVTQLSGKQDFDVVFTKGTPALSALIKQGHIYSLDEYIKSDDSFDATKYSGLVDQLTMDGKTYALPFRYDNNLTFYNKDLFDAAGIDYPDENTTWDEFHEMAKALTKDGVSGFGNAATNTDEGTFQCLQWLYTAGGSYTDIEDGVDAYKLMQEMIEDGSWTKECVNWTQSDVNNNFMAGNLAMQQNGPWQIPGIEANAPDLNYGVTVLPKKDADSEQATSILGGENMGVVNKDDTSGAEAFLKYYHQTDVMVDAMKQYGSYPPKTEAAKDSYWTDDPIQKAFLTQIDTSIPRGPSAAWPSYSSAIQTGFQEVMTSAKTPEQAAKDTQAAVDAVK